MNRLVVAGQAGIELVEFVPGASEADLQALDLAEPALSFCFGDPVCEVVADLLQSGALAGVWAEQ